VADRFWPRLRRITEPDQVCPRVGFSCIILVLS